MSISVLSKDSDLRFPHFIVLKASAGSGKTYALSRRFVQFILSEHIKHNSLRNILAVTFSNNAVREMKERILKCLKELYFGDEQTITEFSQLVLLNRDELPSRAGRLIDEILGNYSDFNVKTIDSFTASLFKASAIDFGYSPEFEIVLSNDAFMEYSFNLFLRKALEGSQEAAILEEAARIISAQKSGDSSFLWDPASDILKEMKKLYIKLSGTGEKVSVKDFSKEIQSKCREIKDKARELDRKIQESGLSRRNDSSLPKIIGAVERDSFAALIGMGLKNPPVKKPDNKADNQNAYERILKMWSHLTEAIKDYYYLHSLSYYTPYLRVFAEFNQIIENTKKQQGKIFLGDINLYLASYLHADIVPDIYFRIGETLYHYLIDEFQDTSPIQWNNLVPLIENSLAQSGSLFVVGDTKQAIYGFRNADYRIMKALEIKNPFPSAEHIISELEINYRSQKKILEFNEKVFKGKIAENNIEDAKSRSGLSDYNQYPKNDAKDGYVEVSILKKNIDEPPEKKKILDTIDDLRKRGYCLNDIAVLTPKNESVIAVSGWLNEANIEFISMSSLDIRSRKVTGELISLINFLNSPIDNLSFATFITGGIFLEMLNSKGLLDAVPKIQDFLVAHRNTSPLYKAFQKEFEGLWEEFFAKLFRLAGYLPLYELTDEIIKTFALFNIHKDEEAALAKVLDVVRDFEASGFNSLRDFLEFAGSDLNNSEWDMPLPSNHNAVKVMTIHMAKGLDFPVVIALLYGKGSKPFDYIEQKCRDRVNLLKITSKIADSHEALGALYNEERIKETVNSLNSLYVGLTRAKDELYIVAVKGDRDKFPFDLLPDEAFPLGNKPSDIYSAHGDIQDELPLYHHTKRIADSSTASDELLNLSEIKRGEFVHNVLSRINYADKGLEDELKDIIRAAGNEMRLEYQEDEITALIMKIVNHDFLGKFFARRNGRTIKKEMEIADNYGNLYRVDRLICDEDKITVIDYKTGAERDSEEKYISQIRNYLKILRDIYPNKKISGILAYIDFEPIKTIKIAL